MNHKLFALAIILLGASYAIVKHNKDKKLEDIYIYEMRH
jgi:hypothetical protein